MDEEELRFYFDEQENRQKKTDKKIDDIARTLARIEKLVRGLKY